MNKKFIYIYLKSQLPIVMGYLLMILLLFIVKYAYDLPRHFIGDVFRYSILILIFWLITKFFIDLYTVNKLDNNHDLNSYNLSTPLETKMLSILHKQKQNYIHDLNIKDLSQKDKINQMDLTAHEIKNYLTTLKISVENESNNYKEMAASINGADYQLDMLLNYERLFSSTNDFNFEWINLEDLVKNILQNMSMQFINKQLITELNNLHIKILSDKKWLYFCIEQLISNAIKYSYQGTKICIIFDNYKLIIVNEGENINQTDIKRIFDKGFTGSNGHGQRSSTGLGLFLVKTVCTNINIKVDAKSNNNQTEFSLIFQKAMIRS